MWAEIQLIQLKPQVYTHTETYTQRHLIPTIVEVSLLVHHECLDLRAVVFAEGEGPGVLWPELVFPGAPEVDSIHQGQPGHAAEVLGW